MRPGVTGAVRVIAAFLFASVSIPRAMDARQLAAFQHGAAGTAQAGALTGSVADASAVTYNPAALARLDGFQLQVGLDLNAATDTYVARRFDLTLGTSTFKSDHPSSWLPAIYAAWTARGRVVWSVGVGIDSPASMRRDRPAITFPVRLRPDLSVRVTQVHPVAAVAIDRRWSIGAGVRYLRGAVSDTYETLLDSGRNPGTFFAWGQRSAEATARDWATDFSLVFREARWGFGALITSGATLMGTADSEDVTVTMLGPSHTARAAANLDYLRNQALRDLGIDLAPEVRGGVWLNPWRTLRVETDLAFVRWSSADWLRPREQPTCGASCRTLQPRDWRDTLSLRLGAKGQPGRRVGLSGGFAYEPSPVRSEPFTVGLPLGPTRVFGAGLSFSVGGVSLDGAYSFHTRRGPTDETGIRYSSQSHILAASVRTRF